MTGGLAEVADFRDGLFGPVGAAPDAANIQQVFGAYEVPADAPDPGGWAIPPLTAYDRAARYMAWMALGGTKVQIPLGILEIVSLTQVLNQPRALAATNLSANMLSSAKGLCTTLLGANYHEAKTQFDPSNPISYSQTLIHTNGDAELWLNLCSLNNPPPLHVLLGESFPIDEPFNQNTGTFEADPSGRSLVAPTPAVIQAMANVPVGAFRNGQAAIDTGLQPDNEWPWCVYDLDGNGNTMTADGRPQCPDSVTVGANAFTAEQEEQWTVRGAINAGFAVFEYIRSLESMTSAPPDYDQCGMLP